MNIMVAFGAAALLATECAMHAKTESPRLTLVDQGRAVSEIVIGAHPTKSAQLGAYELQHHVALITGARIPLLAEPSGKHVVRIFIGDYPGKIVPKTTRETSIRRFEGKDLILSGGDTTGYGRVNYHDYTTYPCDQPGDRAVYGYNGTLFAVYDFLEDLCGVLFFWLGDEGTAYEKRTTLSVAMSDREHTSSFDAFRVVERNYNWPGKMAEQTRLWEFRWRIMKCFGQAIHNTEAIYFAHWGKANNPNLAKAFVSKRPELFAQGYEGRGGTSNQILNANYAGDRDLPPQVCYSNADTANFLAEEALTYFNGKNVIGGHLNREGLRPTSEALLPYFTGLPWYYPLEGNDTSTYCRCPKCTQLCAEYDITNLKFSFMGKVAEAVAAKEPRAGISTLAYAASMRYPDGIAMPENLSIQLCLPYYTWWHPMARTFQLAEYDKWKRETSKRVMTIWHYIFSTYWDADLHHGRFKCFPGFYPWKTGEIVKQFAKDGFRGYFAENMIMRNYLEAYVAARVAYDPSVNVDELLDEYFKKVYGKAADSMKSFYRDSEDAYWRQDNCPEEWKKDCGKYKVMGPKGIRPAFWCTGLISPDIAWGKMGTDGRVARMDTLLKKADKEVDTVIGRRWVDHMKDIWKTAMEGREEYKQKNR